MLKILLIMLRDMDKHFTYYAQVTLNIFNVLLVNLHLMGK